MIVDKMTKRCEESGGFPAVKARISEHRVVWALLPFFPLVCEAALAK